MYNDISIEKEIEIEIIKEALELYEKELENTINTLGIINKNNINPLEYTELSSIRYWKNKDLESIRDTFKDGISTIDKCDRAKLHHLYFALYELRNSLDKQQSYEFPSDKDMADRLKELYDRQALIGKKFICRILLDRVMKLLMESK